MTNSSVKIEAFQNDDNTNESSYGSMPVSIGTIFGWDKSGTQDVKIENCHGDLDIEVYIKDASQLQYNGIYGAKSDTIHIDQLSSATNTIKKYYLGVLVQE